MSFSKYCILTLIFIQVLQIMLKMPKQIFSENLLLLILANLWFYNDMLLWLLCQSKLVRLKIHICKIKKSKFLSVIKILFLENWKFFSLIFDLFIFLEFICTLSYHYFLIANGLFRGRNNVEIIILWTYQYTISYAFLVFHFGASMS